MARPSRRKVVRPIGNRRDFEGASAVAKRMADEPERDSAAELRLKSLLHELEKYDDEMEEDEADAGQDDYEASEPRRRWSDDG